MKPLETELATYRDHLPELLKDEGKYAVVHGDQVLGTFGTYEDALRCGYRACGLKPFMVKEIFAVEPVYLADGNRLVAIV